MPDLSHYTAVANDGDIQSRVAACAAMKGVEQPEIWAANHRWKIATFGTIAESYEYAETTKTINVNQNTGQRTDTILDTTIEDAVDAVLAATTDPDPVPPPA